MSNNDTDTVEDALEDLASAAGLSGDIVAAKNGSEASRERLAQPRTLKMEFPGNRERAMGHALVIIEDLEELGIEAEREYHEQVKPPLPEHNVGALHRIDIHVEGGVDDSEDSE